METTITIIVFIKGYMLEQFQGQLDWLCLGPRFQLAEFLAQLEACQILRRSSGIQLSTTTDPLSFPLSPL